jgi:hypothetical protein
MRSEQQHIDDFFRNKEEEWSPDNSRLHAHWQQMSTLLTAPATTPAGKKVRIRTSKSIIKYLSGFAIVTVITIVAITSSKHKKTVPSNSKIPVAAVTPVKPVTQKSNVTTVTKTEIPVKKEASETTAVSNKNKKVPVIQATSSRSHKKQPVKIPTTTLHVKKKTSKPVEEDPVKPAPQKPDAARMIAEFYNGFKKAPQEFLIKPNRDTTLVAKEGTKLIIPANVFVSKAGAIKSGIVKIIITEYYTYDDIVAAKLSTTSDGEQLVTGGMIHLDAESAGEPVQIAPNKTIDINMPAKNRDDRMQLFVGASNMPNLKGTDTVSATIIDNAGINWRPVIGWTKTNEQRKPMVNTFDLSVDPIRVNYGKKTTAKFYIANDLNMTKEEIRTQLQQRYKGYYDKIKLRRLGKRRSDENMIDTTYMDLSKATRLKLVSKEDSARYAEKFIKDVTLLNKTDMSGFQFTTGTLGWMNCDRFSKEPGPKVNFTINLGEGAENFVSQLVFTRFRSVMNCSYYGNRIRFANIPENEPVQLVSVGVRDGKIVSCIQSITTSAKEVNNLNFEETTPAEFRKKLESLLVTQ